MIELIDVQVEMRGEALGGSETLGDFSFAIPKGCYAVLMGQTGVGKTTILEAICGLRSIRRGKILVGGIDVSDWSPRARNIGYVPQDLALFPHLNVREHLAFALQLRGESPATIGQRVDQIADWLGIAGLLDRGVANLSGGEAQRVALGRALSFRPSVLLLDEPLSALDETTRATAQTMLADLNKESEVTVLHVTHNRNEAAALADIRVDLTRDAETGMVLIQQSHSNQEIP